MVVTIKAIDDNHVKNITRWITQQGFKYPDHYTTMYDNTHKELRVNCFNLKLEKLIWERWK